jgi:protein-S-isoprenylcysteine O-methyltransferase Ste14
MFTKPTVLVTIQFTCLGYLIFSKPSSVISMHIVLLLLMGSALVLAFSAFKQMKLKNFSVSPIPVSKAELITTGPYAIIRHPMYTAVLMYCTAMVIEHATWDRGIIYLILVINLAVKIQLEEKLLNAQFVDYATYQKRTYKLIPYIY